jgi:hypothetical protein
VYRLTEDLLQAFDRKEIDAYIGSEEELRNMMQQAATGNMEAMMAIVAQVGQLLGVPSEVMAQAVQQVMSQQRGGEAADGQRPGGGAMGATGQPVGASPGMSGPPGGGMPSQPAGY